MQQLRLPRALLAALTGALLAVSGALMQGLFRNPLADPALLGATAGASTGASLVIVISAGMGLGTGSHIAGLTWVSLGAFVGALLVVSLVYRLARRAPGGTSVTTMLLCGIAVTALAASLGQLLEYFASSDALRRISLWRMGGLDGANTTKVMLAAIACALLLALMPLYAKPLNALLLGESEARHLGIAVDRLQRQLIALVAAAVAVSVALAGAIGFVGLVVPHAMRLILGPDHRRLLPCSALAGAILLVLADTLGRVLLAPTELPVGLITAWLGAPFFLVLLRRHRGELL